MHTRVCYDCGGFVGVCIRYSHGLFERSTIVASEALRTAPWGAAFDVLLLQVARIILFCFLYSESSSCPFGLSKDVNSILGPSSCIITLRNSCNRSSTVYPLNIGNSLTT